MYLSKYYLYFIFPWFKEHVTLNVSIFSSTINAALKVLFSLTCHSSQSAGVTNYINYIGVSISHTSTHQSLELAQLNGIKS